MAKYTFELRELFEPIKFNPPLYTREQIENWFKDYELTDYLTQEQIDVIESFGIWNKSKLAKKIVDHYYMRESGFETPALFKHYAKIEMQEIMEEYLPLIYSASIKYDPLVNVDYTETFERNADTNSNTDNTGNATSKSYNSGVSINSDTPQGQISKSEILNGKYATSTNASENEINDITNNTSNSKSTGNTKEDYIKRIKGNSGVSATAQRMVQQYRENIVSIDRDIIKRLNYLFMGLY